MQYSSSSLVRIFIATLLILHIKATGGRNYSSVLDKMIEAATRPENGRSQKPRPCQIYSRSTQKHIQIFRRKVLALGEEGDQFSEVELTSLSFGVVTIRGIKTGNYLCVNKKGKPVAKRSLAKDRSCNFHEEFTRQYYSAFRSQAHPTWYLGFNGKAREKHYGKGKKGSKTNKNQDTSHFLVRDLKSSHWSPATRPQSLMQNLSNELIKLLNPKKKRSHSRHRRHRLQTVDPFEDAHDSHKDEVTLPEWIHPPPTNASILERNEWFIRVGNYIKENAPFNQTSSLNVLYYHTQTPTALTPRPRGSRKGRKNKGKKKNPKKNPRRSRNKGGGKKGKGRRPRPTRSAEKPGDASPRLVIPETPVRPDGEIDMAEPPTLSSPSFRDTGGGRERSRQASQKASAPKDNVDFDAQSAALDTNFFAEDSSSEREESDLRNSDLNKDNFARTISPPSEVAVASSRRSKSRRKKGERHRLNSRKRTSSPVST